MREKLKNRMRSAEEKEQIVLESFEEGRNKTAKKYDIHVRVLGKWRKIYQTLGIDGLRSQTGRAKHPGKGNPLSKYQRRKELSKEEQLEFENMKLKIEVARLKKDTL